MTGVVRTVVAGAVVSSILSLSGSASAELFTSIPFDLGGSSADAPPFAHLTIAFKAGDITIPPPGTTLFDLLLQPSDSGSDVVATSINNPNFDAVAAILSGPFVDTRADVNGGGVIIDFLQNVFPGVTTFGGLSIQSITLEIFEVTVTAPSANPEFPQPTSVDATFKGDLVVDAVQSVPEPASVTLLAMGVGSLLISARRSRSRGLPSGTTVRP